MTHHQPVLVWLIGPCHELFLRTRADAPIFWFYMAYNLLQKKCQTDSFIFPGVQGQGSRDVGTGLKEKSMKPFCISFRKGCKVYIDNHPAYKSRRLEHMQGVAKKVVFHSF